MGELIRARGLAVAVARTLITNCPEASPKCPDGPGTAITGGATCASACVLVLAGGIERLAAPSARIGVHQTTTLVSETEGLAHLKSTRKIYEQQGVDAAVEAYLGAMGVGEPVMTLMRKTFAASIRWLSLAGAQGIRISRPWRSTPPSRSWRAARTASTPTRSTAIRRAPISCRRAS